jgi:hypothetical protein
MVDTGLFQSQLPLDFEDLAVAFSLSRLQVTTPPIHHTPSPIYRSRGQN